MHKSMIVWTQGFFLILPFFCLSIQAAKLETGKMDCLDGSDWLIATDPDNLGREQKWWQEPRAEAKQTRVPWIIQDAFPGYHGVAWYWKEFTVPANPHKDGRYILRFWQVDYLAEIWVNGIPVGSHEGGEDPFELDVTGAVKQGSGNQLVVRVLNPTDQPIDGYVLWETPHRNKIVNYSAGSSYNHGGIVDSVELLTTAAVRVVDVFAQPDVASGKIRIETTIRNTSGQNSGGEVEFSVSPAASGETLDVSVVQKTWVVGDTVVDGELQVNNPRLWQLNDPALYRVTVRIQDKLYPNSMDEYSVKCGYRTFVFQDGYFQLNGRRIFLRCSHTGNHCPIGLEMPHEPDLLRRDLVNCKVMGFNAIRFLAGVAKRYQLDLCDEIGLMVYESNYAGWVLGDSPKMAERFNHSTFGMIRRDRNHASINMWELLNETGPGAVFRQAVAVLPEVRKLDSTRLVMLNSGRFDGYTSGSNISGPAMWTATEFSLVPHLSFNNLESIIVFEGSRWEPKQLAVHAGEKGEYSVVRWSAPQNGDYEIVATFTGIAQAKPTTSDIYVFAEGKPVFVSFLNLQGKGNQEVFKKMLSLRKGDTVDVAAGVGTDSPYSDTTALEMTVTLGKGETYDLVKDFSLSKNPNGVWSYGYLAAGSKPDLATFTTYAASESGVRKKGIGSLSNPGSLVWEDVLYDQHRYLGLPQKPEVVNHLRTLSGGDKHVFLSEYGVGSGVNLARVWRLYEQNGYPHVEDGLFYKDKLDRFLADFSAWKMDEAFGRPEDFFDQSLSAMGEWRLEGLNAIRSNPNMVGYSLTGTVDQGMSGEGLTTTFRKLKPGTIDDMFDGWAPLRLCLFAEPLNVYRGRKIRLEAVLANEDVLLPGEYPVHVWVFGPNQEKIFDRVVQVTISDPADKPPFATSIFNEEVAINGPEGQYRWVANFERGAAATGGEEIFYVLDPAQMIRVEKEVVLWGEDADLAGWLKEHGIASRSYQPGHSDQRELILVSRTPAAPGGAEAFADLYRRIAQGSAAVFLVPEVFHKSDQPLAWAPLKNKGSLQGIGGSLYHPDHWNKVHPIFAGMPSGDLMDYTYYQQIIPDLVWVGMDGPEEAVAGGNNVAFNYSSGLMVAVYKLGVGKVILNTLRIRENLGPIPQAEKLLRNLLNYASLDIDQPQADLTADFEEQLKTMGYYTDCG